MLMIECVLYIIDISKLTGPCHQLLELWCHSDLIQSKRRNVCVNAGSTNDASIHHSQCLHLKTLKNGFWNPKGSRSSWRWVAVLQHTEALRKTIERKKGSPMLFGSKDDRVLRRPALRRRGQKHTHRRARRAGGVPAWASGGRRRAPS